MTRRARTVMIVAGLLALQALAVVLYLRVESGRQPATRFATTQLPGTPAPALAVEHADGRTVEVAGPAPSVRIVHFWATWCEPCVTELPTLIAEAKRVSGVELVAVSVDEHWNDVHEFFPDGIPPEVVKTRDREAHRRYGSRSLPDSYLLSTDGRLVERITGARDGTTPAARAYLRTVGGSGP